METFEILNFDFLNFNFETHFHPLITDFLYFLFICYLNLNYINSLTIATFFPDFEVEI